MIFSLYVSPDTILQKGVHILPVHWLWRVHWKNHLEKCRPQHYFHAILHAWPDAPIPRYLLELAKLVCLRGVCNEFQYIQHSQFSTCNDLSESWWSAWDLRAKEFIFVLSYWYQTLGLSYERLICIIECSLPKKGFVIIKPGSIKGFLE